MVSLLGAIPPEVRTREAFERRPSLAKETAIWAWLGFSARL